MTFQRQKGQCFVAIDPQAFAPGFTDRMTDLIESCRSQEPAEGQPQVLVAGDPERSHMKKCDQQGGVAYHINQIEFAVITVSLNSYRFHSLLISILTESNRFPTQH